MRKVLALNIKREGRPKGRPIIPVRWAGTPTGAGALQADSAVGRLD
jgi:hypothetical protein